MFSDAQQRYIASLVASIDVYKRQRYEGDFFMPAKRGERKETNDKKTLLISLLIGNALGAAIFFILLSIASAVMLKNCLLYTSPVSRPIEIGSML